MGFGRAGSRLVQRREPKTTKNRGVVVRTSPQKRPIVALASAECAVSRSSERRSTKAFLVAVVTFIPAYAFATASASPEKRSASTAKYSSKSTSVSPPALARIFSSLSPAVCAPTLGSPTAAPAAASAVASAAAAPAAAASAGAAMRAMPRCVRAKDNVSSALIMSCERWRGGIRSFSPVGGVSPL